MAVEAETAGPEGSDTAIGALEDVAVTAEHVADEQCHLARQARSMARRRREGASWTQLVDGGGPGAVLRLIRHSAGLLAASARELQGALVRALAAEGLTTRQIGRRFGVSHQRISAIRARRQD